MRYELLRLEANQLHIMKKVGGFSSAAVAPASNAIVHEEHKLDELVKCGSTNGQNCSKCSWVSGWHDGSASHGAYDPWIDFGLPSDSTQKFTGTDKDIPLACRGFSSSTKLGGCMSEWAPKTKSGGQTMRSDADTTQLHFYLACKEALRQVNTSRKPSPGSVTVMSYEDM